MTSAVEQLANKHAAGGFVSIHDASNLQNCLSSPFWFREQPDSESRNSMLLREKASQVAFAPLKGAGKESVTSESGSKLEEKVAMPHWLSSDLVQVNYCEGHSKIDVMPNEAPCTPMQSFHRQKYRPDETPESVGSLPSLSLSFSSAKNQSEETVDVHGLENYNTSSFMFELPSSQQTHEQQDHERSYQLASSTPSKTFDRILQGLQREGPEFHKENLLSLSLTKHEKIQSCKKLDPSLSFGHCSGQPHRVLARLGGLRRSTPPEVVLSQQAKPQLVALHNQPFCVYSGSSFSLDSSPLKSAKAGKGGIKPSVSLELSASAVVLDGKNLVNQQQPEVLKSAIQTSCSPAELTSENSHGKLNLQMKSLLDSRHQSGETNGNFSGSVSSHVLVNKPLSLLAQSPVEGVRCFPLSQSHPDDDAEQQECMNDQSGYVGLNNSGKRQRPSFLQEQLQNERWFDYKQCPPHFVEDAKRYNKEAKIATKKKMQAAAEEHNTPFGRAEVANTSMWHDGTGQDEYLQPKYMRKHITFTDNGEDEGLVHSKTRGGMSEKQTDTKKPTAGFQLVPVQKQEAENVLIATASMEVKLDISASGLVRHEENQLSDPLKESTGRHAVGLKLFTIPAYSQMPRALSTFSTGEPSLPLSLELSQKLPDLGVGKVQQLGAASDADWGKFLALSATSETSGSHSDGSVPPYQQRFKQLQAFLKLCDESDQKDRLIALRSLSAAARSGHAVDLETRAIRLSLEEGKEMIRMKNLNVLGRNGIDADNTSHGPRLLAPGAASTTKLS